MKKIVLILSIFIILQFVLIGNGAAYGESLANIDEKINSLREENRSLEITVAKISSYNQLSASIKSNTILSSADLKIDTVALRR